MTQASISNFQLQIGDAASPEAFNAVEEVLSVSGFGLQNELVDVTNFDSPNNSKEYIGGLADGAEITAEANYVDGGTYQTALRTAIGTAATRNFRVVYTGGSPDTTWAFAAVCLGWEITPSPDQQNRITFRLKISGTIS